MGIAYLVALVLGAGALGVQFLLGHGHDADASGAGGGEADADGHGGPHSVGPDHDPGVAAIFFSTRFWTYALLAFGMVGSALHLFALAGAVLTAALATAAGLGSGSAAALTFRAIGRLSSDSSIRLDDARGQVGRVLVACSRGRVGKVRLQLKGQSVDVLATTDEEGLGPDSRVLVQEVRGDVAHVGKAPDELLP